MTAMHAAYDPDRLAEASAWRARLRLGNLARDPELDQWLAADPRNLQAWEASAAAWSIFDDAEQNPAATAAIALAMRRTAPTHRHRRLIGACAAAAVFALALGLGALVVDRPTIYQTSPGNRDTYILADGSRVTLDAGSRLEVRLSDRRRALTLTRGQAAFDVAHDRSRPFEVTAGDHRVVALGTRFTVDLASATTTVTLVEGRVQVQPVTLLPLPGVRAVAHGPAVALSAGQALKADNGRPMSVAAADIPKATAWESGQLVFDEEPLADVAARISRYGSIQVEVRDPALANRRISGVFRSGDLRTFLDAVEGHLGVKAVRTGPGRIELRAPPT